MVVHLGQRDPRVAGLQQGGILPWDYEVGFFTHGLEKPLPAEGPELAEYDRLAALAIAGILPSSLCATSTPASHGCGCRRWFK